jgi:hypothetical protein
VAFGYRRGVSNDSKGRGPAATTGGASPSAAERLERGVAQLAEVLGPAGFQFVETEEDVGSGGAYASGEFRRGDRRLELHFRSSLGLVRYHFGEESLSHQELVRGVRALERISEEGEYPGFSDDPMAGFHHLRHDLDRFGGVFLHGGAKAFRALKKWLDKHPKKSGLAGLGA